MRRPTFRPKDEGSDRPWQDGYRISESSFMDRSWRAVFGWPGTWLLASVAATVNAVANVADGSSEAGFTVGIAGLAYLALFVSLRYRDRG